MRIEYEYEVDMRSIPKNASLDMQVHPAGIMRWAYMKFSSLASLWSLKALKYLVLSKISLRATKRLPSTDQS